jgi:hypothetical protein
MSLISSLSRKMCCSRACAASAVLAKKLSLAQQRQPVAGREASGKVSPSEIDPSYVCLYASSPGWRGRY